MTGSGAEAVGMRLQTGKISGGEVENAVGIVLTGVKLTAVNPLHLLVKEHNIHPSLVGRDSIIWHGSGVVKEKILPFLTKKSLENFTPDKDIMHKTGNVLSAIFHIEVGKIWFYNDSMSYCSRIARLQKSD